MQQVAPSTSLRLVYLIQDHTDLNTYYVRAVVRNSVTGAILATVDLADTGDRRFYGTYNTPSTEDMYIDITTTVYSDSGYTTKAQDKYEDIDQYLVKTQWGLQFGGAGGGDTRVSEKIDYKLIKKLVKEALGEEEKKEPEKYDDTVIKNKVTYIEKGVGQLLAKEIEMPKMPEPTDLTPVLAAINGIKMPEVNYPIILETISKLSGEINNLLVNKEIHKEIDFEKMLKNIQESERLLVSLLEAAKSHDKLNKIISDVDIKGPAADTSRIKRLMR